MSEALSPNTQAILLLTAPLLAGRGKASSDLLTPGEYKKLARHLRGGRVPRSSVAYKLPLHYGVTWTLPGRREAAL